MPNPNRSLLRATRAVALAMALSAGVVHADATQANLAPAAKVRTSFVSGHETLAAIADDADPRNSRDHQRGAYGNWPRRGTQWVEYEWDKPVSTDGVDVYWWADNQGIRLPTAARLSYWDGKAFVRVDREVGVAADRYNTVKFDGLTTTRLRLEMDGAGMASTGIIEFKVYDTGASPAFPPTADAGPDRVVALPAVTYLSGGGNGIRRAGETSSGAWSKASGPGDVTFADPKAARTTAAFSQPGQYELKYTYTLRGLSSDDTVTVQSEPLPATPKLNAVYVSKYKVDGAFWRERLKNQIVNWIPHCVAKNEEPNLREGGLNNLIEAGKKLRGEPARAHRGYPFANAWVLNTAESMCVALTLDPQGDADIIKAQDAFRATLDKWVPIILAAQEPDGYFQTRYTLGTAGEVRNGAKPRHWDPALRAEHEGYIAGYFIELGIAHHIATGKQDRRLFDAAIKLADCWVNNIGPAPKKPWYDGHQEVEQALVRLGRYVNDLDGPGKGRKYIDLAKFLLDSRSHGQKPVKPGTENNGGDFFTGAGGGEEYDQSHAPITQQYAAVGHAVRASYTYSAMADVAMETGDPDYWSATLSIWDNIVNRKYYLTGGIGSGETSEGFGRDYSLPNNAYAESCSGTGQLFMQYKLNLATRNAKYADLYETTLYNAILGDVDLEGQNFTYTNPLDSSEKRYKWHVCPCCVGNIPRTLLMLPTWMYATSPEAVFVNLYAGSTVNVGKVAGTEVELIQSTDYPWKERVSIKVNPKQPAEFTLNFRSPQRDVSTLYTAKPNGDGITSLSINGQAAAVTPDANGYVAIKREWQPGDTVEMNLPLPVQTVTASEKVAATRGRVALRRGPLVYNLESVDGNLDRQLGGNADLGASWTSDLLGGVVKITGTFADGSPLVAVPNYARLNRGGRSIVWFNQ